GPLIEDLGMDSLHLLMLITEIEKEYSIKIDILRFDVSFTIDEFADLIQESIITEPHKEGNCND
ncbi:MAG TPA: acyl carrier protein, partial [Candidatus Mediterraneibacter excrementigallinarum]|nr:acyl carrier protein [Candidatus Mediterraneibacter excrementigallinarum]